MRPFVLPDGRIRLLHGPPQNIFTELCSAGRNNWHLDSCWVGPEISFTRSPNFRKSRPWYVLRVRPIRSVPIPSKLCAPLRQQCVPREPRAVGILFDEYSHSARRALDLVLGSRAWKTRAEIKTSGLGSHNLHGVPSKTHWCRTRGLSSSSLSPSSRLLVIWHAQSNESCVGLGRAQNSAHMASNRL